ncbi:MAG: type IV pilus assembly protein PilM [bacterium]
MLLGKKNHLFALDIGSSSLKLAEVRSNGRGYQLLNAGMMPLPPDAIVEGAIMNASAVVEAIRNLLEVHRPRTRNVATSVSGHSVIIKKISLPSMSPEELSQSIQWEAEQYVPFNIHEVNLDYQILPAAPGAKGEGSDQMSVLLVAAKKELVEDYATLLREADLRPVLIDVDSFAVENMYEANYETEEDELVALFNIGASVTNINVFKDGVSLFTRDIHFGGNQFNEEIQKDLSVGVHEAEQLKIGLPGTANTGAEVRDILGRVTETLLTEVQRSLEFFAASSGEQRIHKVVLCGGCSSMNGLVEKTEERLGIPVEQADPFRKVTVDSSRWKSDYLRGIAPFMGVSMGLAIRRVGEQ